MGQTEVLPTVAEIDESEEMKELKVGIVGCGRMGRRRAQIVKDSENEILCIVADTNSEKSQDLADDMECRSVLDWRSVVYDDEIDVVVVSVPNKYMAPVVVAALEEGKHVLCEKPLGRNRGEGAEMVAAADRTDTVFHVGFNKRFHPAARKMKELFDEGVLGPVLYSRAIFGHGAHPGLEKTWFGRADLAGGGALIDIGVHLVDLIRWFQGDFQEVFAAADTYYWDLDYLPSGQRCDDNAFFIMRAADGQIAQVHASWTQWKNRFSYEIFGRDGYLRWEGLGGYYGPTTVTHAQRRPESGPPILNEYEFDGTDNSLQLEWEQFVNAVRGYQDPATDGNDALKTMEVIEALYDSARTKQMVTI
jgi:predicted dehydrogenase